MPFGNNLIPLPYVHTLDERDCSGNFLRISFKL
uniref:Uncharacterized protein n=1 Tax=Arundo donax TaxID=35708 RepID=A0A0A9CF56_ARUDO